MSIPKLLYASLLLVGQPSSQTIPPVHHCPRVSYTKMSKGVRGLHDGLVKTGKFKGAKVIDEFNPNHISFNSFCAIFDRRLAVSHATLCVELRLEGLTKRQFLAAYQSVILFVVHF